MTNVLQKDPPTTIDRLQLRRFAAWQPRALTDEEIDDFLNRAPARSAQLTLDLADPRHWAQRSTLPCQELPEAAGFLRQLIPAILECRLGQRPATQIVRWLSLPLRQQLIRQNATARRRGLTHSARPVVRKVHLCVIKADVVEASIVAVWGGRTRAIALRMSGLDAKWTITHLEIG